MKVADSYWLNHTVQVNQSIVSAHVGHMFTVLAILFTVNFFHCIQFETGNVTAIVPVALHIITSSVQVNE